ncbi:MAG: hypothetical protein SV062_06760 [Thermodesulfobacteriota bacterium]|nr:hypothetical protein [Thermodesulfobacteriota bacterium]
MKFNILKEPLQRSGDSKSQESTHLIKCKRLCENCYYFDNDPLILEETFKGINILSSVHGSSRGGSGICSLHNRFLMPDYSCLRFIKKSN